MARHYGGTMNWPAGVHPSQLADKLSDPDQFRNPDARAKLAEFRDRYIANMMSDGHLQQQVDEQAQIAAAQLVRNGAAGSVSGLASRLSSGAMAGRSARQAAFYNQAAPGAAVDKVWSGPGEMFAAVAANGKGRASSAQVAKLNQVTEIQNSFAGEDPGSGGFLVPELMRSELLMMSLEDSVIRSRATVIPMSTLRVPIPIVDDTSHASSVLGGITFFWAEESAAMPESQASFGRITLDAKKLTGFFKVPNELLADAPAFGAFFDKVVPAGHAWWEDLAFLTETGAGTPEGIIGSPAYITVTRATASKIQWADVVTMYSRMLPQCLKNAVWIANIDTFPQLATMVVTGTGQVWNGTSLINANMPVSPATWFPTFGLGGGEAPPTTLLGRPIYFTEKVPALGTAGDISLVDPSFYLIGDRQAVGVTLSEHFAFQNDQTAFRIISRLDGRPWLQTPLTPHADSSNTLSAYVGLHA